MANRSISFDLLAVDKASKALAEVGKEVTSLAKKIDSADGEIRVDADTSAAREKLAAVDSQLARLNAKSLRIDADTSKAQRDLAVLQAELKRTTDEDRQMRLNLDISAAQAKVRQLAAEKVSIDVETAGAQAKIRAIEQGLRGVSGKDAKVKVDADVAGALANLARVAGAVAAIPTAVTVAVGAIGGLAGAGAALGLGFGAAIAGTTGLGDAVKALGEKSTAAGGAATVSASAIRSANQAVVDARRDLVRANEDVEIAEADVSRAQEDARRAQDALADARRSAARELEDYTLRAAGMALSEESAALSVAEAQDRLRRVNEDSKSTALERARAELNVREAIQRQNELTVEARRLTEDKTAADAKGVEGSAQVVAAQDKIRSANDAVAAAQRNLKRANEDVTKATERVAEALLRVKEAAQPQGGAAGGVDKVAEAMDNLGPKGQAFARYLRGLVDGPLKDLRIAGQEAFLPGVQRGLQNMEKQLPGITPAWAAFSREVGNATGEAIKLGAQLGGPLLSFATESLRGLQPLGQAVRDLTGDLAGTFDRLADSGQAEQAMRALSEVLAAVLEPIPELIDAGSQIMVALGPGLTDIIGAFTRSTEDALPGLVSLAGGVGGLLSAVAPVAPEIAAAALAFAAFRKISGEISPVVDAARAAFERLRTAGSDIGGTLDRAGTKVSGFTSFVGGPWGLAIGGATIALGMWAQKHVEAAQRVNELTTAIEMDSGALGTNTRARVVNALESDGALKAAQALGISLKDLTDATLGNADAQARVNAALEAARTTGYLASDEKIAYARNLKIVQDALGGETEAVTKAVEETRRKAEADGTAATAAGQHSTALGQNATAADGAAMAMGRLTQANQQSAAQFMSSEQASLRYEEALARATTSVDTNGRTVNVHTEAGRANREALLSLVNAANDQISAMQRSNAPIGSVTAAHDAQRAKLVEVATQMGMTKAQAQAYITKLLETPKTVTTDVRANTAAAMSNLQALQNKLASLNGQLTVTPKTGTYGQGLGVYRSSGGWVGRATGRGMPFGGGPRGTDTVPGWLSPDEFVVRSSAAQQWGPLLELINAGGSPDQMAGVMSPLVPAQRAAGAATGSGTTVLEVHLHGVLAGDESAFGRAILTAIQQGVARGELPRTLLPAG